MKIIEGGRRTVICIIFHTFDFRIALCDNLIRTETIRMNICYLRLLTLVLSQTLTVSATQPQTDIIEIDNEEVRRVPRQISEGSGMWDYNMDDEDLGTVTEYGSTNIVSSRVIPVASSPMFTYPGGGSPTQSYRSPNIKSSGPAVSVTRGPARPPRLNSYYPDLRTEGSGGEESFISSLGQYNDSDLISPTRSHQFPGQPSSLVPVTPHLTSRPANHEPFIGSRLDKVPLTSGKSSRYSGIQLY